MRLETAKYRPHSCSRLKDLGPNFSIFVNSKHKCRRRPKRLRSGRRYATSAILSTTRNHSYLPRRFCSLSSSCPSRREEPLPPGPCRRQSRVHPEISWLLSSSSSATARHWRRSDLPALLPTLPNLLVYSGSVALVWVNDGAGKTVACRDAWGGKSSFRAGVGRRSHSRRVTSLPPRWRRRSATGARKRVRARAGAPLGVGGADRCVYFVDDSMYQAVRRR